MAVHPFVVLTIQSSVLAAFSNVLAQALTAYRNDQPLIIDWIPVFQFFLFAAVSTPPNLVWQEFLESTFPAYHIAPTKEAIASASAGDDKALDRSAAAGHLVEPKLNVRNTLIKTALDQTAGATVNTLLFSNFMHGIKAAMAHRPPTAKGSADFLLSGRAVDYSRVDWRAVWARSTAEFASIIRAGWSFWPFVSLFNFAFVKGIAARNLIGSLAGIGWGVYMSLFAAR